MGLGGSNATYYIDCLRALLSQNVVSKWGDDFKIAVSGCMMHQGTKDALTQSFGNNLSYNFIDQNLPLGITFNDTIWQCVKHFGEFEGYLYLDSGVCFWDPSKHYDAIEIFYNAFKEHDDAFINAFVSNDMGGWWNLQIEPNKDHIIPVGKTTNLHLAIFPNEWLKNYNNLLPDIFASNCSESVFSFMTAAIKKKFVLTQKINALHLHSLDGASIGSRFPDEDRIPCSSMFQTPGLLFKTKKDMDYRYAEGRKYGFGFEECAEFWKHDPTKFEENNFAKDPGLLEFLKTGVFLTEEEFSYNSIKRQWSPGK